MSKGNSIDQQIIDFLKEKGAGTVDDVAAAVKISRTSARKYLAGLTVNKTVHREPGGREGRRKLPDVFSLPGKKRRGKSAKKATSSASKNGRLGPGELDKHVLDYMRKHKKEAPHTPSAIAKAIERSSGAVANCLGRMEKDEKARLVKAKPRQYELAGAKK
ncbi:MAG TPA: FaeA/PapI family transcriptional regulator [Solirubrobacterales bacterium]|nr:FaeA/PapI family transcriptional regulator [Solirubrobacterales bacterium]